MVFNWNLRGDWIRVELSTIGSGVDATDAIDATDAAMVGGTVAASTTDKPKWYILDMTEIRVFPITFEIRSMPKPSPMSSRIFSSSTDQDLPINKMY
jgi:hypothetical protein